MSKLWRRFTFLLFRRRFESQLDEEMRFHLEMKAHAGGGTKDAGYAAQRQFGNTTLLREESRDMWGWVWLETLVQDLRYGARMLAKNPGFTLVATATLALGIAVNTTIFSAVSGWLLKKPPVADPDRMVVVVSTNAARAIERGRCPEVDFLAWRDENHVFAEMAAADPYHDFSLTGAGDPERLTGMRVTANYFPTLGVSAFLGRTFLASEAQLGRDHVVVLTYGLWQRRFASDANIVGKTVALDGEKYVVIGVMPASFRQLEFLPRLWAPLVLAAERPEPKARDARSLVLFGRLKSGVDLQIARAEMTTLAQRAEQNYPASAKGWSANVMTLQEYTIEEDQVRTALAFLMTAVVLVLVIACANIANLLLARAGKRQQEIAIRIALGAGRLRVIRQLLVESLLIALIGGTAGLFGAYAGIRILRGALNLNDFLISAAGDIALDHRVLVFTCLVSIGAALLFGLAPAIRVSASDPQGTLRQGGRTGDLRRGWGRDVLVGGEIALALVLLVAASLIIKATEEERTGDFGFNPKQVLTANISLTSARYHEAARRSEFFQSVLEKAQQMPGVEAAGIASSVPFAAERRAFKMRGQTAVRAAGEFNARYFAVSPGQFRVLSTPLIRGREFGESDNARAPHVAIVNRVFAERFLPGQDPLGHYIRIDHDAPEWSEIVGIVGNIRGSFGPKEDDPQMYEPYLQVPMDPEMWVDVRAEGDPNRLAGVLRSVIWSVDPEQPIAGVRTIARIIDENEGGDYVADTLFGIFGIMALVLSAIGIYGVVSYAVAQRTHEIGIRMALGAHRADVLRSVIGKGMVLAIVSVAVGLAASAPLPKLFAATLQGFRVHSLPIFVYVPLVLLLVVLAAIYIPARRAARVDPMVALRYE
jgi:predicted permease